MKFLTYSILCLVSLISFSTAYAVNYIVKGGVINNYDNKIGVDQYTGDPLCGKYSTNPDFKVSSEGNSVVDTASNDTEFCLAVSGLYSITGDYYKYGVDSFGPFYLNEEETETCTITLSQSHISHTISYAATNRCFGAEGAAEYVRFNNNHKFILKMTLSERLNAQTCKAGDGRSDHPVSEFLINDHTQVHKNVGLDAYPGGFCLTAEYYSALYSDPHEMSLPTITVLKENEKAGENFAPIHAGYGCVITVSGNNSSEYKINFESSYDDPCGYMGNDIVVDNQDIRNYEIAIDQPSEVNACATGGNNNLYKFKVDSGDSVERYIIGDFCVKVKNGGDEGFHGPFNAEAERCTVAIKNHTTVEYLCN